MAQIRIRLLDGKERYIIHHSFSHPSIAAAIYEPRRMQRHQMRIKKQDESEYKNFSNSFKLTWHWEPV
jgi:hypothetical protein